MAGQFDKFVKILGNNSRPAVYKGAPGNPDIVAPVDVNIPSSNADVNGGGQQTSMPVNAGTNRKLAFRKADLRSPKRPAAGPLPGAKAPVAPIKAEKDTKVDKTPEQREAEAGEYSFNRGEEAKGSTLRSLNGVTYDLKDYSDYLDSVPANEISKAKSPYDISDFEPKSKPATSTSTSSVATPAPTPEVSEPVFKKVDKIKARKGGTLHGVKAVRDFEEEHPDSPASSAATGKTLSEANRKTTIYNADGSLKPEYNDPNNIHSTTMHEVNGEVVEGGVHQAPYTKPTVNKPGNVIPPIAMDTFGSQPVDRKQAEAENKRLRENRTIATRTTVVDQNKTPARPARGQTPERQAVLGAIREKRSAALATEGKTMTTVHPEVMDTAKRLGRTSMYNLDEDYMNSTGFLAHEAIQKATVAHALGVHHTLGTDDDHLHKYLGGKPLEAKSRLAAAYKVVDRNLRGNPEKVAGEFALLRGMVHAGSSPQQTLRAVKGGKSNDVVVNGQNVQLAKSSSENRIATHAKASKIVGAAVATPTAPLAGTNRVAVRTIGQAPEEATIREFSPQELRNKGNVPTVDDSRSKLGPVEKAENESIESSDIISRLKKGKRPEDVADES
jgi:hypothetical protein